MNRHLTLARFALTLVLAVVAASRVSAQDEPVRYRIPVTRHEPSLGPEDAPVTIVVFNDFECPFCSRAQVTVDRLVAAHPRDVRIVHRNNPLPFHQNASLAAQAAMEAFAQGGSTAFWRMHKRLFENQRALGRVDLERYASELRLDLGRFRRALDDGTHLAEIDSDQAIARLFHIEGTPGFMINGRRLMGAQPYDAFDAIVRDELQRATVFLNRGTPRARLYAELTRDGRTRAEDAPTAAAPTARRVPDPTAVYAVPIGTSPVRGRPDALVTIVEITDLQCPFCARVQPALAEIARSYGRDVRFVLKHNPLPFHDRAVPAARLLVWAATRGDVWPLHDRIFANQRALTDDDLVGYAVASGLDAVAARAALSDTSLDQIITADQDLARELGAVGTPAFFINGRNLRGAQPVEAFRALIDEELARARAHITAGTARTAIYESIVRSGLRAARTIDAPAAPAPAALGGLRVDSAPAPAPARAAGALAAPADVATVPAGAVRTASGLASRVIRRGSGARHPGPSARVEVHYTGWTTDGRMFDSSVQRGSPAQLPLSAVIPGWTEGVQLMVEGETRRVWIPAALAYGESPRSGRPGGMLVFDIELLRILD